MIPLYCPTIDRRDMTAVLECMIHEQLTAGAITQQLIAECAQHLNCAGGLALRDWHTTLNLLFALMSDRSISTLLASPLSPFSLAEVAADRQVAYIPLPLSEKNAVPVASASSHSPHALFLSTPLGFLADVEALSAGSTIVIEDIGEGLGGTYRDRPAGSFGHYVLVTLEAENIVTAGGGTLLLGRSKHELAILNRLSRSLPAESYLSDLNAALGMAQLKRIEDFVRRRRAIYQKYRRALQAPHSTFTIARDCFIAPTAFPIIVSGPPHEAIRYAASHGVEMQLAYRNSVLFHNSSELPEPHKRALAVFRRTIIAPLYPTLNPQEIKTVEQVIRTLP